jgi:hypothetical protein
VFQKYVLLEKSVHGCVSARVFTCVRDRAVRDPASTQNL